MIQLPYLSKPRYTEPCNGCGLCCALSLCEIAQEVFPKAAAPCPALEYEGGRTWCGMVRNPAHYLGMEPRHNDILSELTLQCLPIGNGCGMSDPDAVIEILPAANASVGVVPDSGGSAGGG